jgi:hypothetical protein
MDRAGQMEKEARFVQEILAKLNQNEKMIGGGAIGVVLGWILGLVLGSTTVGGYNAGGFNIPGVTINYFSWGTAGLMASLAVLAAIVGVVVLYIKMTPSIKVTWPVPVGQILLGIGVAAVACAALTVLFQVTNNLTGAPVLMYVADLVLVAGGAAMAYGAYMEWTAGKTAA